MDKIFHQYLGTNYTLEMLRNKVVVAVSSLELDVSFNDFKFGPQPGTHYSFWNKYMSDKHKLARFNIKTSLQQFRGFGINFSPDFTNVYLGLYEWNGNPSKLET